MAALRQVLSGGKDGDMNGDVERGGEIWWWSVRRHRGWWRCGMMKATTARTPAVDKDGDDGSASRTGQGGLLSWMSEERDLNSFEN